MQENATRRAIDAVVDEVSDAVIINHDVLVLVLTGLLARGHVLLEDVPGTGKTLTARSTATALGLSFNRIQFTPDLLPADVTGTEIYDEHRRQFEFQEGPLFSNIVLADEINRASPKTQSALLEAMEERQVTVAGKTHPLPDPFFVIATQNSVETGDGTFPLPEAQKDRFILKTRIGYPSAADELVLLDRRDERSSRTPTVGQVLSPADIATLQGRIEDLHCHQDVKSYIVDIVQATRADERVRVGVSPRGSQRLFELARARALVEGRGFVTPDDVKVNVVPAFGHRILLTTDARINNVTPANVLDDILADVPAPMITHAEQA